MRVKSALVFLVIVLCTNVISAQSGKMAAQLFTYEEDNLYGFEDASSEVVINPQFPLAWDFYEGLARV